MSYDTSFENLPPVASAGPNQAAVVGESVSLDATTSHDPNQEPIVRYEWTMTFTPEGSLSELMPRDPSDPYAYFNPDLPGTYIASVRVFDPHGAADEASATTEVITVVDAVSMDLMEAIDTINEEIDVGSFRNASQAKTLTNKINAKLAAVRKSDRSTALRQSEGIISKIDGCALSDPPAPDRNDWIELCYEQAKVYPTIIRAADRLATE